MIILLIGKNGQLSSALKKEISITHKVFAVDRYMLSLSKKASLEQLIDRVKPNLIINAAAYTQVDQAELEKDLAFEINALLPKFLSNKAQSFDIPIIHISTNYIFDGSSSLCTVNVYKRKTSSRQKEQKAIFEIAGAAPLAEDAKTEKS